MKYIYLLLFTLTIAACQVDFHSDFCDAIVHDESQFVKQYIDDILWDLPPIYDGYDPIGHLLNLETLVAELNRDRCVDAVINCYACVGTIPPQSELHVIIDDGTYFAERIIIIATPWDGPMYFVGMY